MSEVISWAIVDAAAEPELFLMLEQLDPPHASLYAEPVSEELERLAPCLVQVNNAVHQWLMCRKTPWGILLESKAEMSALRQHLRKYLHVQIPNEGKPVFFRFYDPRNIWPFLAILSPWEQHSFLGPIDTITTSWKGELRRKSFKTLKEQFNTGSISRRKIMKISQEQMDKLTLVFERRYIEGLVEMIENWGGNNNSTDINAIGEIFYWLKKQGITDDRSIRGLFCLFYERGCLTLDSMPLHFRDILCAEEDEGPFKAETLLIQELGDVPL